MNDTATGPGNSAPGSGRLVAFRRDRLGARLLSIVNAWRIARDHDLPFCVHWPVVGGVGTDFNDPTELFSPDFVAQRFIDADTWRAIRPHVARIGPFQAHPPETLAAALHAGTDVMVGTAFDITVLEGEDPAQVTDSCREIYRALPFAAPLQATLGDIAAALDGAVAYHVRRGDLSGDIKARNRAWPHKYVPEEYYRAHIRAEIGRGSTVVLFSDCPATVARMQDEFPQLRQAADFIDTAGLTPAARDFLELWAMSSCARIIAPEASAFSTTASDLGGVEKVDAKSDLSPEHLREADEALLERMRAHPDGMPDPGDVGQCLLHLRTYLTGAGRAEDAAALYRRFIERGLDVSFVQPQAIALAIACDELKGAIELAEGATHRLVYHEQDLVHCRILEAVARIRTGDAAGARRALVTALWMRGDVAAMRRMLPALVIAGGLDKQQFLPAQPGVLALAGGRIARHKLEETTLEGVSLAPLLELVPPEGLEVLNGLRAGAADPLWWDWEPVMARKLVAPSLRKGPAAAFEATLEQALAAGDTSPALAGSFAMLRAHQGDTETALAVLDPLSRAEPHDAATLQRLSHVHWLRREWAPAAEAALGAVEADDAPAYHLWAGMCMLKRPDARVTAIAHLRAASEADTGLASAPALLATALERDGRPEEALAAIDAALLIAPGAARLIVTRAQLLRQTGRHADAMAALWRLIELEKAPMSAYPLLAELHLGAGETDTARAVLQRGLGHKPDSPQLNGMLREIG